MDVSARISIQRYPTNSGNKKRNEKRAPLKTPAWEATKLSETKIIAQNI